MSTEAELGYQDAIRQVQRSLARRLKSLQENDKNTSNTSSAECKIRISEIEHLMKILESLHR